MAKNDWGDEAVGSAEAGMRAEVSGDIGADPAAARREIAATQVSLTRVSDPSSRQLLQEHLTDMQRQLDRVAGVPDRSAPAETSAAPAESPIDWGDKPDPKRDLPADVTPSSIRGGRGKINPDAVDPSITVHQGPVDTSDPLTRVTPSTGGSNPTFTLSDTLGNSVLRDKIMPEPKFDPREAERLSNRKYAEQALLPDDPRLGAPKIGPDTGNFVPTGPRTAGGVARDVAATIADLPLSAANTYADVSSVLTGGAIGPGAKKEIRRAQQAVQEKIGTPESRQENADLSRMLADKDVSAMDVAKYVVTNPMLLGQQSASAIASFALPLNVVKVAKVLGVVMTPARATQIAMAVNDLMNAGQTFNDTDSGLAGKYGAAAIAGIGSHAVGMATGGGMEGALARSGAGQKMAGVREALVSSAIKEPTQEYVENASQSIGQDVGEGKPIDLNSANKQGALGAVVAPLGAGAMSIGSTNHGTQQQSAAELARSKGFLVDAGARIKALRAAGENNVADVLEKRVNTVAAETELPNFQGEPYYGPAFEQHYRGLRAGGLKPAEASSRAAMFSGFTDVAEQAGMTPKAIQAAIDAAGKKPLDEVPAFLDRFTATITGKGMGTPVQAGSVAGAVSGAGDAALGKAVDTLYGEKSAAVDKIAQLVGSPAEAAPETAPDAAPTETPTIDHGAHEAASSPLNSLPEPTKPQILAGNAKLGHIKIGPLDISVENPDASVREDKHNEPPQWQTEMQGAHYGYVKRSQGADGDQVDVFVKAGTPEDYSGPVFVIDQLDPKTGKFDEHKSVIGAATEHEASDIYHRHYEQGWMGAGGITRFDNVAQFNEWVKGGKLSEPLTEAAAPAPVPAPASEKPAVQPRADGAAGSNSEAVQPDAALTFTRNESGTLTVNGDPKTLTKMLADKGITRVMQGKKGVLVGKTEADKAEKLLAKMQPKTPKAAPVATGELKLGMTPAAAEPVTVKNGIVHVGKSEALDFDSGEPIRVAEGATHEQIKQALKDGGAVSKRAHFYGGDAAAAPVAESSSSGTEALTTVKPPEAVKVANEQASNPTHKEQGKPAEPAVESLGKSGPERNQSGDRRRADARAANPFKAFLGEHGIYYERDKKMDYTLPLKERQRSMVQGFPPIFRRTGKQIDMLAQAAVDEGFLLTPNVTELAALIDKTLTRGERVDPQFSQDYMAQVEAEKAQADFPEGDFIPSELEESGYVGADQDVQDRVRALLAQAQAAGLDAESLLEDVAKLTENATEQIYYDAAEQALTAALARQGSASEANRSAPAGGEGAATGQAEGLTAPTEADALRMGLGDFTLQADKLAALPGGSYILLDGRKHDWNNGQFHVSFSWGNGKWSAGDTSDTAAAAFKSARQRWIDRGNKAEDFKPADKSQFVSGVQSDLLSQPTKADILAQQAQREAEAQRQQDGGDKPAKARPTTADQIDLLNPQGGIFDAPEQPTASAKPKVEGKEAPQALKGPEGGKAATAKIEDFGEKLEGARKDYAALLKDAMQVDVATAPLSKAWPEPDYTKLLAAGTDPWTAAFVHAARDSIPTKPQKSWKVTGWVENVTTLRNFADKLLNGEWKRDAIEPFLTRGTLRDLLGTVELYERLGHEHSLKGIKVTGHSYSFYRGQDFKPPKTIWMVEKAAKATAFSNWPNELAMGDTREQAIQAFIDKVKATPETTEKKTASFDLWRENGKIHLGKKIGREYITLKTFEDVKAAREYRDGHQDELTAALEKYRSTPFERKVENAPRVGEDHRGGARMTPEVFADTFGFRGVQFGNYVENSKRQQDLNDAYDSLMDMAAVLGVPPKALSLNGQLGLAFGARGKGGIHAAAAHYERDKVVINLTKNSGAGSLAHEWFHAVDNYFAKLDGGKGGMMTEGAANAAVRVEMQDAFKAIQQVIRQSQMPERSRSLDKRRSKPYWSTYDEMAARSFEAYIIAKLQDQNATNDYLANVVSEQFWKAQDALMGHEGEQTYPYPTEAEMGPVREAFDKFFGAVQTKETDSGVALYDIGRNPIIDRIAQQGYEKAEVPRVQAARRLTTLLERFDNNKISDGRFQLELKILADQMSAASETKQANRTMTERKRGADLVREKLIRARRQGDLDNGTVEFALWLLDKNPALAEGLGVSVRSPANGSSSAGRYNPAARVMTLFKDKANEGTAVHEILHHSERMMPQDVQKGINDAWAKAFAKVFNEATPEQKAVLGKMFDAMAGNKAAHDEVVKSFRDGVLDYDQHYQLTNPSEFWAVNATRIMGERHEAQSWAGKAKQWLSEMIEKAKGAFGLASDAPIIKGLRAVLEGDGTFQSKRMLSQATDLADIAQIAPKPAHADLSPWRDASGRLQFAPGAWLYNKMGKAAAPMLAKVGLKPMSPELARQLRQMNLAVAKAQETSASVAGEAMKLSEDERAMVSDLIEQELTAGTIPPEHAVRLAGVINGSMNAQTDELVRLGMLSKDSAEMWRGKYLPRYYKSKLSKQITDAWADAVSNLRRKPKSMVGIKGKHLKGRGLYETIAAADVAKWAELGWTVRDDEYPKADPEEIARMVKAGEITQDDPVAVWRDFTREERDSMGEIRDAGFRFVMGYMQTQRDIALGRMFEGMANDPEMSAKKATDKFTVRVPDGTIDGTGAKRYGMLGGRYVAQETLSHLSQIEEASNGAWRMYRQVMSYWKMGKTIFNPVAHFNNVVSNLTMANFAGIGYHRFDKYFSAAKDFATKGGRIDEANEAGLFLGTMSDAELMNTLPEELRALVQEQDSSLKKIGRTAFDVMTFFTRKPLTWAYQNEDVFFRYLIYKDARDRGMQPSDAVDWAQEFIFTYDDLPKGARRIRDFGIPFFAYTYKAIPALAETALKHPIRFLTPAAILAATNAMSYAFAVGGDDDDWWELLQKMLTDADFRAKALAKEEEERKLLPTWLRGASALFTPRAIRLGMDKVTQLPMFLDATRLIPGGDLFDAAPNAAGVPWLQPFTPSHPIFTTAVGMFGNKDLYFGKDIVDMNDTTEEATRKRLGWLWRQMSPAIAYGNFHFERAMNAIAQATGHEIQWLPEVVNPDAIATGIGTDGNPTQPGYAAMQTAGIKVRPIDLDTAEQIDRSQRDKMLRDIDAEMRKLSRLSSKGAISDKAYERAYERSQVKKDRLHSGQDVNGNERQ
jgi:hypothetical protein